MLIRIVVASVTTIGLLLLVDVTGWTRFALYLAVYLIIGSDAAIEAADVVLMDDDPMKIGKAIRISRKCLRIVRENIVLALGVKGACLVLGIFGIVNMWLAIFADVGVMILAVLNAVRAMYVRRI